MKYLISVPLFCLILMAFVHEDNVTSEQVVDEREKVLNFLCNNADSLPIFLLSKEQIGDTLYVHYADSINVANLRAHIFGNYLDHPLYSKLLFRDSMNCKGIGSKHNYVVNQDNIYQERLLKISSRKEFFRIASSNEIYFFISRPLIVGVDKFYWVSMEQKGTSYLERVYIKVNAQGCVTEVGAELGIM